MVRVLGVRLSDRGRESGVFARRPRWVYQEPCHCGSGRAPSQEATLGGERWTRCDSCMIWDNRWAGTDDSD
jgi:hypothetical protein